MGIKSRGNWALGSGISQKKWNNIFGNKAINKYALIFFVGIIETFIYTCYLLSVANRQVILAPVLMFTYMTIYLSIITKCIKDADRIPLILVYSLSCSIGTLIRLIWKV